MRILAVAVKNLSHRPLRSLLTMLTAAMGIAAVVSSSAILYGAHQRMQADMSRLGLDVIIIQSKPDMLYALRKGAPLTRSSINTLQQELPELSYAPLLMARHKMFYPEENRSKVVTVIGTTPDFFNMYQLPASTGQFFTATDLTQQHAVCVADQALMEKDFSNGSSVGRTIQLTQGTTTLNVRIQGILQDPFSIRNHSRAVDTAAAARNIMKNRWKFKNIYLPITLLTTDKDAPLTAIMVKTGDHHTVDKYMARLEHLFEGIDVEIMSQKTWITGTLQYLDDIMSRSNVVWIIILGVASIMIITITLVSVRERYYEIAIRMTEGATRRQIIIQFALENMFLTIGGGILGLGIGHILNLIVSTYIIRWKPLFSVENTAFVLVLSVVVGMVTSIIPARKAASLKPVDVFKMR